VRSQKKFLSDISDMSQQSTRMMPAMVSEVLCKVNNLQQVHWRSRYAKEELKEAKNDRGRA
jgi:hypothetical protein